MREVFGKLDLTYRLSLPRFPKDWVLPPCASPCYRLEECMLTSGCCASLASVLIRSKTLKKLNLLGNDLRDEGILQLLEALGHPDCVLEAVG